MKFHEYLLCEEMSYTQALKVFGLTSVPPKEELNKLYKALSRKNHPDLGGSEEAMKEINQAKDVLDKKPSSSSASSSYTGSYAAAKERERELKNVRDYVLKNIFSKFDVDAYTEYFEKIFSEEFFHESKNNLGKDSYFSNHAEESHKFYNKTRDVVFDLYMFVRIYQSNGLTSDEYLFDVDIETDSLVNKKKLKITNNRYQKESIKKVLSDPTSVFPKSRIEKLASGEVRKGSALKKSDVLKYVESKYKGSYEQNTPSLIYMFIPFSEDLYACLERVVLLRKAAYQVEGIYKDTPLGKTGKVIKKRIYRHTKARYFYDDTVLEEIDNLHDLLKGKNEEQAEKIIKEKF